MKLHDLRPAPGSISKSKRIGRGYGSGKGKTGGKGMMGQKARSGPNPYRTFEGGQNRLVKRMPFKRGFTNIWRIEYQVVNIGDLETLPDDAPITPETLLAARVIRKKTMPVKILGNGDLSGKREVHAHKFSGSARQKIEAVGGTVVEVPWLVLRRSRSRGANPRITRRKQAQATAEA